MRDILAPVSRGVLDRFARAKTLLAFDFDGTLAPIVADPDRAAMRTSTRRLLESVARVYPCVVISGRSREDVGRRLRGVGLAGVVGNHGLEPWHRESRAGQGSRRWIPLLQERLGAIPGIAIEDKGLSIAVHYRQCRDRKAARARVLAAAARLGPARLLGGKEVLNILPAGAPHKGLALERARARLRCEAAVYVGDDETDEDVFALGRPERLLGVRVGRKRGSAAAFYVRTQADVDRLLRRLLAFRSKAGVGSGPLPALGETLEFMPLLWAIDHGLQRRSQRMAATLGLTGPQRLVVRMLGRYPGISAGQLAQVLHLHPSTLTGILRRLERRGWLTRRRHPRDGRRAVLGLSEAGRRIDVEASGTIEARMRSALRTLPPAKVRAARTVLHALAAVLEDVAPRGRAVYSPGSS
jgi:trehalose 6-phosphate phosphatase